MFFLDNEPDFLEPVPLVDEAVVQETSSRTIGRQGDLRARLSLIFFSFAVLAITSRLLYITLSQGQLFSSRSERNRLREMVLPAGRGQIFDRYGRLLASNIPVVVLGLRIAELPPGTEAREELKEQLSRLYVSQDQIYFKEHWEQYLRGRGLVTVPIALSQESAVRLSLMEKEFFGITALAVYGRSYPLGASTAHAVGYVGLAGNGGDNNLVGRGGLEQYYQSILRGEDGIRAVEVDTFGQIRQVVSESLPRAGRSLVTNLDAELGQYLDRALAEGIARAGARRGSAVVLDPKTGAVLALSSYPAYDANLLLPGRAEPEKVARLVNNSDAPFFFRSITGAYPPGSTIKPLWAALGLASKTITPDTVIRDNGFIQVSDLSANKQYIFWGWKRDGLGAMTVRSALAWSSDIFFYALLGGYETFRGLGIDKAVDFLERFRFGEQLGIDLPGEVGGLLPSPEWKKRTKGERWFLGDTYNLSIGQGDLLTTPLQVASFTAAVANGGTVWRPRVVGRVLTLNGQVEKEFSPEVLNKNIFTPESLAVVQEGLRDVVKYGTARSLLGVSPAIAGKTGTAEWGAKGSKPHAWFTGYAPAENPELVITIMIERGGEGSEAAVPIAAEVIDWYFNSRLPSLK